MRKEDKRRTLVALFAAAMSLSAFAAPRLAFQVYAVRELCEKDFPGTLKAAKAMGFEGVETGRFYGLDAKGLKDQVLQGLRLQPHQRRVVQGQRGESERLAASR